MSNLLNLLKPEIIEVVDAEKLIERKLDTLQSFYDANGLPYDVSRTAYDPARIQIETSAYDELLLRQRINEAARANILAFSTGNDLDHLGDFHGVERMASEDDERFRARIRLNRRGNSTGGTEPRYKFFAMSADIRVKDAIVYRKGKSPIIYVAIFGNGSDGTADEELIKKVDAALHDKNVIMTNDTIVVHTAVHKIVDLEADVWLLPDSALSLLDLAKENLLEAWANEQALGRDISLSWWLSRLMLTGVHKVKAITPFTDIIIAPEEAAAIGTITLNFRGRDY